MRRTSKQSKLRTLPPGVLHDGGGAATCGVCGERAEFPASTPAVRHLPAAFAREMKRNGWKYSDTFGWAHVRCERSRRREIRAGHVQLDLMGGNQ